MKYVLDASVALRWVISDPTSAKAIQLRDDYQNGIHELLAPDIFIGEVANALTKAERQKLIPIGDAVPLLGKVLSAPPILHCYVPPVKRASEISSRTRSGFYDCLYLVLAEQQRCEFVTVDQKLVNNLQPSFPFVISLTSLP